MINLDKKMFWKIFFGLNLIFIGIGCLIGCYAYIAYGFEGKIAISLMFKSLSFTSGGYVGAILAQCFKTNMSDDIIVESPRL